MPGSTTLEPALVEALMSERRMISAFQAGFGGKADVDAHNLRPGRGNRGKAAQRGCPVSSLFQQSSLMSGRLMNIKATVAGAAHEPTLRCPNCNHEIRLTESLAAPLLAETRQRFQDQMASKDVEVSRKIEALRLERELLARDREQVEERVSKRLATERGQLIAAEAKKAREATAADLQAKEAEAAELRKTLEVNNAKLAEAQQQQAELMRRQRALDEEKRELDLTVEKRVQASIAQVQIKARQEADEAARLRVAEKDQTIESMTRTIEELKRKAEQGSQQSQGEVLELELEVLLRGRFPTDLVEPVGKGELGADVVQQVNGSIGQAAGIILWESKRTKAWSDGWLAKLRDDQRRCGADVALIISQALPKHIEHFDLVDGVWVAHPRYALPVKSCHGVRKARAEVAAYADCTESQMMAMFGWTDPKMPAHYIAKANREKLGISGMDKIVAFDQSQPVDDLMPQPETNSTGTSAGNGVVTFPVTSEKKRKDYNAKRGFMVRSERLQLLFHILISLIFFGLPQANVSQLVSQNVSHNPDRSSRRNL
jgi:hypothetical protein